MRADVRIARRRLAAATARIAAVLLAALLLAPRASLAESLSRGQGLYEVLGCGAASCHGPNPAQNLNNVLNGAGSPATIEYASVTRPEMNALYATFISDATAAQDLAAWLRSVVPATPPPPSTPTGPTTTIVEYFHAGFGHYFVSGFDADIQALDSGRIAGWTRTGKSFKAFAATGPSLSTVCRFFTEAFAPRSSHFYTPVASECAGLRSDSRDWQYEGDAFYAHLPDASGSCPLGSRPVFRLYNNGQSGAPNHRYTTDADVRTQMVAAGWLPEGYGPQGVIFCSPD